MRERQKRSASGLRCPWTAWYCDCKSTLGAWPYPANGKLPKRCQEILDARDGKAPRATPQTKKQKLWRKYAGKPCPYCGQPMGGRRQSPSKLSATIDHIVPRSRGGSNAADNKVVTCVRCNEDKGNKSILTWLDELIELGDPRAEHVGAFMFERGVA